jgi:two-component system, OmpR family, phosphate regulon sensor histidine kinase PhoR
LTTALVLLIAASVLLVAAAAYLALRATRRPGRRRPSDPSTLDLAELERERRRAEEILDRMAEGVLVLNESLTPSLANRAARKLLGLQNMALPPILPSNEILSIARRAVVEAAAAEGLVSIWFPARVSLRVRAAPLMDWGGVVVLLQDVTEELRTQQMRSEFVAHASHELKSPVASLQSLAEALQHAVRADPAAADRFSRQLVAEAERLGRLVTDLLDLSRLEEPGNVPNQEVDLAQVAQEQIEEVRGEARTKALTLDVDVEPDLFVMGDGAQLGLMIRNLLDNAVRYTSDGGEISILVRRDGRDALVRVGDDGAGIPLHAQARVFERFYRVDEARSRDRGGTGLGLAIVKHVVELHGGRVELESELGQGSTFTVHLPRVVDKPRRISSLAG